MKELYDNIRKRRQQLNMTQEQLADKMGYSEKSMISKIEKGKVNLSERKIEQFAKVLQISPVELMGYVFEPEVQKQLDEIEAWEKEYGPPLETYEKMAEEYKDYEFNKPTDKILLQIAAKTEYMTTEELEDILNYVKFVEWKRKQKGSD